MIELWISGALVVAVLLILGIALLMRRGPSPGKVILLALAVGNAGFLNAIEQGFANILWWQVWMNALAVPYIIHVLRSSTVPADR